jgi:hypothetical protein
MNPFQEADPNVLSEVKAQPIACSDRSFSLILSACFARIAFLHLR